MIPPAPLLLCGPARRPVGHDEAPSAPLPLCVPARLPVAIEGLILVFSCSSVRRGAGMVPVPGPLKHGRVG
jgi:hypothetical protein